MTAAVLHGAMLICSCGLVPSALLTRPRTVRHTLGAGIATVEDCLPLINIPPFGGCTAPGNPSLLLQKPCLPQLASPWTSSAIGVCVAGVPALSQDAMLPCLYGGVITIGAPGQAGLSYSKGAS